MRSLNTCKPYYAWEGKHQRHERAQEPEQSSGTYFRATNLTRKPYHVVDSAWYNKQQTCEEYGYERQKKDVPMPGIEPGPPG
ncbi:hypothetical protein RRG08_034259 [Elysia crispata]|uniref:Uncharacterized protein n=1 Tax=Elysia crispata TaxID=231223 RepID=A0AAE1A1N6_9GAST|nr:hypothetical protein RRG08_034259 [Elysia crispata]